jgi:hypothetical protein
MKQYSPAVRGVHSKLAEPFAIKPSCWVAIQKYGFGQTLRGQFIGRFDANTHYFDVEFRTRPPSRITSKQLTKKLELQINTENCGRGSMKPAGFGGSLAPMA